MQSSRRVIFLFPGLPLTPLRRILGQQTTPEENQEGHSATHSRKTNLPHHKCVVANCVVMSQQDSEGSKKELVAGVRLGSITVLMHKGNAFGQGGACRRDQERPTTAQRKRRCGPWVIRGGQGGEEEPGRWKEARRCTRTGSLEHHMCPVQKTAVTFEPMLQF